MTSNWLFLVGGLLRKTKTENIAALKHVAKVTDVVTSHNEKTERLPNEFTDYDNKEKFPYLQRM